MRWDGLSSDVVSAGEALVEDSPPSDMVSHGRQLDCEMDVPQSQLVNRQSMRRHAHCLVPHVDCDIQLQHQPQATSTMEEEDR